MTEQSMTEHTRAEHDRTDQTFSPPDTLGLLDFKNRPPGQPHPACRGRQTPSCPASSRAVQEAVGRPRPRPPPAGLGASRGGGLVRRSGRDCGGREGERGEGRREGGGREGGGKERGGGGHEPRRMVGIARSKIIVFFVCFFFPPQRFPPLQNIN